MRIGDIFRFRKRPNSGRRFNEMPRNERKQFLSNDLIERMIRVEQRVFESFGESVSYKNTKYYKSLTPFEKDGFERYIKGKGVKNNIFILFFFGSLVSFFFLGNKFTGNVVREGFNNGAQSLVSLIVLFFFLIVIFLFAISFILRRKKERNFRKILRPIDRIILKRRINEMFH